MAKAAIESSFGGTNRRFPETSWGLVSGLRASSIGRRHGALEKLCRRYWKAAAAYLRAGWGESDEDAKDLAQDFFLWLSQAEVLKRYAPERGGFRPYLKGLLRNFMLDQWRSRRRVKRGGRVTQVSVDAGDSGMYDLLSDGTEPDALFDRLWKEELMGRAIKRAQRFFSSPERAVQFRVFEEHDLAPAKGATSYAEVAARLDVSESDVRNYLFNVREKVRAELRAELAETVQDPGEFEEEWKRFFGP